MKRYWMNVFYSLHSHRPHSTILIVLRCNFFYPQCILYPKIIIFMINFVQGSRCLWLSCQHQTGRQPDQDRCDVFHDLSHGSERIEGFHRSVEVCSWAGRKYHQHYSSLAIDGRRILDRRWIRRYKVQESDLQGVPLQVGFEISPKLINCNMSVTLPQGYRNIAMINHNINGCYAESTFFQCSFR